MIFARSGLKYSMSVAVLLLAAAIACTGSVSAQQASGAGALTALDYFEIQQLYARYKYAIDSGDVENYVSLFVADGSFNNFVGHEGLRTFMKGRDAGNRRHWNTNLLITGTADGARRASST